MAWIRILIRIVAVLLILVGLFMAAVAFLWIDGGCTLAGPPQCHPDASWILHFVAYGWPIPVGVLLLVVTQRMAPALSTEPASGGDPVSSFLQREAGGADD